MSGPALFEDKPQIVEVELSGDERNSRLVDLNNDSKEDILLLYPSSTGPHRVKMLITQ